MAGSRGNEGTRLLGIFCVQGYRTLGLCLGFCICCYCKGFDRVSATKSLYNPLLILIIIYIYIFSCYKKSSSKEFLRACASYGRVLKSALKNHVKALRLSCEPRAG